VKAQPASSGTKADEKPAAAKNRRKRAS
jgi:hypothetical protein